MEVEPDILEQLRHDFPAAEVSGRLSQLTESTNAARLQRCIVFASRGHPWYFDYLCKLVNVDYRDVIMAAEYDRLNARLYDFAKSIREAHIEEPYSGV